MGQDKWLCFSVLHDFAQALVDIHRMKTYHGDARLPNILVTEENRIVLTDFNERPTGLQSEADLEWFRTTMQQVIRSRSVAQFLSNHMTESLEWYAKFFGLCYKTGAKPEAVMDAMQTCPDITEELFPQDYPERFEERKTEIASSFETGVVEAW